MGKKNRYRKNSNNKQNIFFNTLLSVIFIMSVVSIYTIKQTGFDVKTGDLAWIGTASLYWILLSYFLIKHSFFKKNIYSIVIGISSTIITWIGYYFIFLKLDFLSNNSILRFLALFIYCYLPLAILIYITFFIKRIKRKRIDK